MSAPRVQLVVADLLALPAEWRRAFDLVVEVYTVQALPRSLRPAATAAVGELVAPGGTLVVIQAVLGDQDDPDEGPPWSLTKDEITAFAANGLVSQRLATVPSADGRFGARWLAELTRPGPGPNR